MLTPQEVSERAFQKASFGGYNMAQVDEFLDILTGDYSALFNENAVLKNKMKVLVDKVEEYRSTEEAMRKALMAAQKMADDLVREAEQKKAEILSRAESEVRNRRAGIDRELEAEAFRLKKAQESTAAYVRKLAKAHDEEMAFLSNLGQLVPPEMAPAKGSDPSEDIKAALAAQIRQEEEEPQPQAAPEKPAPRLVAVGPDDDVPPMPDDLSIPGQDELELDQDATRRLSDIQFGRDYRIE